MIEFLRYPVANSGRLIALTLVLAFAVFGCEDSVTDGTVELGVFGTWTGVASLPVGRSVTMTIVQNGTALSGTLRISGVMNNPLTGTVVSATRTVTWSVSRDCERWSGTLTLSTDETQLSGPLNIDRSGCQPAQSDGSGVLSVTRN